MRAKLIILSLGFIDMCPKKNGFTRHARVARQATSLLKIFFDSKKRPIKVRKLKIKFIQLLFTYNSKEILESAMKNRDFQ